MREPARKRADPLGVARIRKRHSTLRSTSAPLRAAARSLPWQPIRRRSHRHEPEKETTMTDWSDAETLWLNLVNAGLGLVVLLMVGGLVTAVIRELAHRARHTADERALAGAHVFQVPALGTTMADGGEPKPQEPEPPQQDEPAKG
jgi:hypothetical protein